LATTALAVGAAAAVASAGVSAYGAASKGKGGGGGGPTLPETPLWEKMFNRGTGDLLDEEKGMMNDALAQANFLQPEMYKLLGFEPVYDERQNADIKGLSDKSDAIKKQLGDSQELLAKIQATKGPKNKKALAREAGFKNIADLKRTKDGLLRQQELADRQLGDAQSLPRRVVGMKKLDQPADPTQSGGDLYRMAFDLQNQTLVRALKGEEPVDATLKTHWDEQESQLRERLRRTLGPDYESSSAGQQALANFDREKGESFQQFNSELIKSFSAETESRAKSLSDLTGARMQQMLFPANAQMQRGLLLGQAAADRNAYESVQQAGRGQEMQSNEDQYKADVANSNARAEAIQGVGAGLGNVGEGITSAGPTLGAALKSYLGSSTSSATRARTAADARAVDAGGGSATLSGDINTYLGNRSGPYRLAY